MLDLRNRQCLVVGGGNVARRKVEGLLADGARVTVVATDTCSRIEALAEEQKIVLQRRPYAGNEAANYALVFAATDDREVNKKISKQIKAVLYSSLLHPH